MKVERKTTFFPPYLISFFVRLLYPSSISFFFFYPKKDDFKDLHLE